MANQFIQQLIQMGEAHPDLRTQLRRIIDTVKAQQSSVSDWYHDNKTPEHAPRSPHHYYPQHHPQPQAPYQVQTPEKGYRSAPTYERQPNETFFSGPHAKQAFEEVLLPQIEAKMDMFSFDDIYRMMADVDTLGTGQNVNLENTLIVYKPISKDTGQFWSEIKDVFNDWIRTRLQGTDARGMGGVSVSPQVGGGGAKKEYNFNFQ